MNYTDEEIEMMKENYKPINWGNVWLIIGGIALILFIGSALLGTYFI